MSATLLAFARPLLDQVEDPPSAKTLQGILNIAIVVWNLPLYEKAKHANAAMLRAGLESALATMPAQGKTTIAAMAQARLTTYADDPRLAFAEVVMEPNGRAGGGPQRSCSTVRLVEGGAHLASKRREAVPMAAFSTVIFARSVASPAFSGSSVVRLNSPSPTSFLGS
jgi:hypothetical protein